MKQHSKSGISNREGRRSAARPLSDEMKAIIEARAQATFEAQQNPAPKKTYSSFTPFAWEKE